MIPAQTSSLWSRAAVPTTPLKRRVGRGPGDPIAAEGSMAPVEFRSPPIADSQIIPAAGGQNFPDYL